MGDRKVYYQTKEVHQQKNFTMFLGTEILYYGEGAERLGNVIPVYIIPVEEYEKLTTPAAFGEKEKRDE